MKEKTTTIIVNGQQHEVSTKELTFAEVVQLAYGNPPEGGNIVYSITYERAEGNKPSGMLTDGQSVKVKEGMIINATRTDKS